MKHLGLGNAEITDAIAVRSLARASPRSSKLLDFSRRARWATPGATALAAGESPKLATLDVSESWLTKTGIAALKAVAKKIESGEQQDDEGDAENRYIAAYGAIANRIAGSTSRASSSTRSPRPCCKDVAGAYRGGNQAWLDYLGKARDDIVG